MSDSDLTDNGPRRSLVFYLASRYSRREELCGYRSDLDARGHTAPARWLKGEHQVHGVEAARAVERNGPVPADQAILFAKDDIEDLASADVLVNFTEAPRADASRGGRHVEFGIALGARLGAGISRPGSNDLWSGYPRIFIVGPLENVFHAHAEVDGRFDTWAQLLEHLDAQPEIHGWSITGNERCDAHPWHRTNAYHERYYEQRVAAASGEST